MSAELIDLDLSVEESGAYLSDDPAPCPLPNPIAKLRSLVVERISVYNYIRVVVNVIWLVENHMLPGSNIKQKINVAVMVLNTYPELNDLKAIHWSTCEDLYRLSFNKKLDYIRRASEPRICCCCQIL
jgi:hypothetical protein